MKFATIHHDGGLRFGLVEAGAIHLADPGERLRDHLDGDLAALADRLRAAPAIPLDGLRFAPVVPDPAQVLCVGLNYQDHRDETASAMAPPAPEVPVIFTRFATTLAGHGEDLPLPKVVELYDFEAEMAVIIGRGGRYIDPANAMDHVAGYACFNDISARDWQQKSSQWAPGKNFPASGPLGPTMTVAAAMPPLDEMAIRLRLNGEVMQDSTLGHLIFDIPTLIGHVSQFVELRPGDVIATGTPGGVGFTRSPVVRLAPGDEMVVEIDGLDPLKNRIVAETV